MSDDQNGFSLYVQNLRRKMGGRRAFGSSAYEAALPGWQRLRPEEQQLWKNRAHELQRSQLGTTRQRYGYSSVSYGNFSDSHTSSSLHQTANAQSSSTFNCRRPNGRDRLTAFPPAKDQNGENLEFDEEDEWGVGAPEIQSASDNVILDETAVEKMLDDKYAADRKKVTELLLAKTDGCKDKIKRIRFLFASAQTFGLVDDMCMMAEVALNEFDFTDGIIDTFSTLVGPWDVRNEVQRSRAVFHSNQTHGLQLDAKPTIDKSTLLMEILGRTEPLLACAQGVAVGLYKTEMEKDKGTREEEQQRRKNYIFLEHVPNRRFLLCLRQEFRELQAAFAYIKKDVGLDYDGFPMNSTDFILADAFVDAVSAIVGEEPIGEYKGWLKSLAAPLPKDFTTPWERKSELFCTRHRAERNSCCAKVTAGRASYIVLYALEEVLQ